MPNPALADALPSPRWKPPAALSHPPTVHHSCPEIATLIDDASPGSRLLVETLEPFDGRVYDPCCGSGGMFVQSEKFVAAHGRNTKEISIYGQESNPNPWRLAHMNLAMHTIEANLGPAPADTFLKPQHPDLKADFAWRAINDK